MFSKFRLRKDGVWLDLNEPMRFTNINGKYSAR